MPLHAFLLGTDVLERFFGNLRLQRSNNDMDSLEMINYTRAMDEIQRILDDNSGWVRKSHKVMGRQCLDNCSPDAVKYKE